jgi:hypothetical protein
MLSKKAIHILEKLNADGILRIVVAKRALFLARTLFISFQWAGNKYFSNEDFRGFYKTIFIGKTVRLAKSRMIPFITSDVSKTEWFSIIRLHI